MSDEDLKDYLPYKGDRVALKAFAREETSNADNDERKLALIESLRKRMGVSGLKRTSDTDDEETAVAKKRPKYDLKNAKKSATFTKLKSSNKRAPVKQSEKASKPDRALMVGFAIYNSLLKKYRQVRAPMGGGIRYPRVEKNTTKAELLRIVCPLFFPNGKNCHGEVTNFCFDISTDVHGTQLMHDESVEDIMERLGLKHFRCYLLAKQQKDNNSDSGDSLPDLNSTRKSIKQKKKFSPIRSPVCKEAVNDSTEVARDMGTAPVTDQNSPICIVDTDEISSKTKIFDGNLRAVTMDMTQQPAVSTSYASVPESSVDMNANNYRVNLETSKQPVLVQYIADMSFLSAPTSSSFGQFEEMPHHLSDDDSKASVSYELDHSGVIQFGNLQPENVDMDKTLALVCEITVHRGRVCHDLIEYFSNDTLQSNHSSTFEIKMLRENGTPEVAEDNGGVMRDSLTEFWDTFYLQFTEGNEYKVPVLRHDMTDVKWKAVAAVIKMGYNQEGVYPIRLAPSFMQQAIFGVCNESDLIGSFQKFVSMMDRKVLETALKDFVSVEEDDINDLMDHYESKKIPNANNFEQIVREIAHKELVQKPMFVANCFFKVLSNTKLVEEDMSEMYERLDPSPKKVLKCLRFSDQMTPEESVLSSYVKRLVREMDDPQYLQLFLRFCTGSDILTKKKIHVRFISSDLSNNARCPSSHTCGCVLEIPRSYSQDPYVCLKSDFLSLLKNRYWQMDVV